MIEEFKKKVLEKLSEPFDDNLLKTYKDGEETYVGLDPYYVRMRLNEACGGPDKWELQKTGKETFQGYTTCTGRLVLLDILTSSECTGSAKIEVTNPQNAPKAAETNLLMRCARDLGVDLTPIQHAMNSQKEEVQKIATKVSRSAQAMVEDAKKKAQDAFDMGDEEKKPEEVETSTDKEDLEDTTYQIGQPVTPLEFIDKEEFIKSLPNPRRKDIDAWLERHPKNKVEEISNGFAYFFAAALLNKKITGLLAGDLFTLFGYPVAQWKEGTGRFTQKYALTKYGEHWEIPVEEYMDKLSEMLSKTVTIPEEKEEVVEETQDETPKEDMDEQPTEEVEEQAEELFPHNLDDVKEEEPVEEENSLGFTKAGRDDIAGIDWSEEHLSAVEVEGKTLNLDDESNYNKYIKPEYAEKFEDFLDFVCNCPDEMVSECFRIPTE